MPQGMGRWFRGMISGLLFLSVLVVSIAQAHATFLLILHNAGHTTAAAFHDGLADAQVALSDHDHTGLPCKGHDRAHGLACCCTSGCPMMLPVPGTAMPAIVPMTLVYRDSSTMRPDGLQFAPTLPPPRGIV
jgi:hypothetical protein